MHRIPALLAVLALLLLLGGCGGDEPAPVPHAAGEPLAAPEGDAEVFEPPTDWCGTGRLPAPRPPPDGGRTFPVGPPPAPPAPPHPFEPMEEEEEYPPSNWCGTGRLHGSGLAGFGWQGPDRRGRWWRVRTESRGGFRVRIKTWGEDRDGRFRTWDEEEPTRGKPGSRIGGKDGPGIGGISIK